MTHLPRPPTVSGAAAVDVALPGALAPALLHARLATVRALRGY